MVSTISTHFGGRTMPSYENLLIVSHSCMMESAQSAECSTALYPISSLKPSYHSCSAIGIWGCSASSWKSYKAPTRLVLSSFPESGWQRVSAVHIIILRGEPQLMMIKVDTCSARVLSDGEIRVAGWTLLSPEERNVKLSPKLEEKVLLLVRYSSFMLFLLPEIQLIRVR